MASVNKVILIGNCGRDPDMRFMPDGTAVANVSIATTFRWKDKSTGENKEETEWTNVVFRARLAEIAGEYLKKGSPAYIEGRLRTRKWTDKTTGADRYTTEIIAESLQLLGSRRDSAESAPQPKTETKPRASTRASLRPPVDDPNDDIPF